MDNKRQMMALAALKFSLCIWPSFKERSPIQITQCVMERLTVTLNFVKIIVI